MRLLVPSVTALAAAVLSTAGCASGSSEAPSASPQDALAQAEQHLDDTSGVQLSLKTDDTPDSSSYLSSAEGTITTAPAFKGTASGSYNGLPVSDIAVVSVDGTFQVDLPIKGYTTFDPKTLCAPDPALLLDPDTGVSSVLAAATDLKTGDQVRGGADNSEVDTTYSGTVPLSAVKNVLPCSSGTSYSATFTLSGDGYLRSAALTGDFSGDGSSLTYTITVEKYDVTEDIKAP